MKTTIIVLLLFLFIGNIFSQDLDLTDFNNLERNSSFSNQENPSDKIKSKPNDFSFTINPYLWGIATQGTVGVPNTPSGYPQTYEFSESFSDALENLKMAFMIGGRLKYKRVSFFYDLVYTNLKNFDATVPDGHGLASANTTNKEFITDLSIGYEFYKGKTTFLDVYGGARIWALESELTLIPTNTTIPTTMLSKSNSWVDPIIGINARFLMGKKWFSYLRSDFGGFGVSSSWNFMILGGFGYAFNPNWNTSLGIKNIGLDYDKDNYKWNVNQYGLFLSFGYRY